MSAVEVALRDRLHRHLLPLRAGEAEDHEELLARIGDARIVLLGEASHGTHEFYSERARITRRLITDRGFNVVAVEADWPDAYRANRYVRGDEDDRDADAALSGFKRFPTWMWRNRDVLDFIEWLRDYNREDAGDRQVGFYGLDLYSLHGSIGAVLDFLDRTDPAAAERARRRYGCFDHYGEDVQAYGYAANFGLGESCEDQVVGQLLELHRKRAEYAIRDGRLHEDELLSAEQNARLVRNAEAYYRSMFRGRVESWNRRDRHMDETLSALVDHFNRHAPPARAVVWAHNSHLGDARATAMGEIGELNLGQLAREHYGDQVYSVGFTTYEGSVTAASGWDEPAERKRVRPGLRGSYEALFHDLDEAAFLLPTRGGDSLRRALSEPRLQRAIGVIYLPETERQSHYFGARLAEQFDAVLHFDRSRAVEPLEPSTGWVRGEDEPPETWPSGL